MRAVVKVKKGRGHVEVRDIPVPEPKAGEVLVKVKAAGLCHTDILLYDWAPAVETEFHVTPPVVMGHEFSGIVAEVGPGVREVKAGDPVLVNPVLHCGRCYFCERGSQQLCVGNRPLLGFEANGGFAEYVVIRSGNVYKLPAHVNLEMGALAEPFGLSIHALGRVSIEPGEVILISGPGPVGMMTLMLALKAGASRVFVLGLGRDQKRLELVQKLGGIPLNVEALNAVEFIREATSGLGVDVAFEAAGSSRALVENLALVRKGGRVAVLGLSKEPAAFDPTSLALSEKSIIGVRSYTIDTWKRCQEILSSQMLDLAPIVSHRLPLSELEKGIQLIEQSEAFKVFLIPEL